MSQGRLTFLNLLILLLSEDRLERHQLALDHVCVLLSLFLIAFGLILSVIVPLVEVLDLEGLIELRVAHLALNLFYHLFKLLN